MKLGNDIVRIKIKRRFLGQSTHYLFLYSPQTKHDFYIFRWLKKVKKRAFHIP